MPGSDLQGIQTRWARHVRGALLYGTPEDVQALQADARNDLGASGLTLGDVFDANELSGILESGLYQENDGGDIVRQALQGAGTGALAGAGLGPLANRGARTRAGSRAIARVGGARAGLALRAGTGPGGLAAAGIGATVGGLAGGAAGGLTAAYQPDVVNASVAQWIQGLGGVEAARTAVTQSDFGSIVSNYAGDRSGVEGEDTYDYLDTPDFETSIARSTTGASGRPVQPGGQTGPVGGGGAFEQLAGDPFGNPEIVDAFNQLASQIGPSEAAAVFATLGGQGGAFNTPNYERLFEREDQLLANANAREDQLLANANAREDRRLDQNRQDFLHQFNTQDAREGQRIANELHLGNQQAGLDLTRIQNDLTLGLGRQRTDQNIADIRRQGQVTSATLASLAQRHAANQQLAGSNYAADQQLAGIQDTNRVRYDLGLLDSTTRQYEVDTRTSADRDIAVTGAEAQRDVAETQAGRYDRLGLIDSYGRYIIDPTAHYQESDLARANEALIARIQAGQIQDREGTIQAQDRAAGLQAAEYAIDNPYGLAAFTGGGGAGLERSSVLADIGRILALQGSGGTASTPAQAAEQNAILARIQASGGLSDEQDILGVQQLEATDNVFSFAQRQLDQQQQVQQQLAQQSFGNRGTRAGEVLSPATSQGYNVGRQDAGGGGVGQAADIIRQIQLANAAPQVHGQTLDFLSNPAGLGAAVQLGGSDYVNQLLGASGAAPGGQQSGQSSATRAGGPNIKQLADQALIDAFNDPNKQTDGASIFGGYGSGEFNPLQGQSQATFSQLSNPQQGLVYGASAAQGIDPSGVQRQLNRNTPNAQQRSRANRFQTI